MEFSVGQVVISKAGRDKGNAFIVYDIKGEYLFLVDGKGRPLDNPKKKKIKHIQPTNTVDAALHKAIMTKQYMKNADFTAALKNFAERKREEFSRG
jgi:ribosomal protein L14E/L6E/L27E